MPVLRGRPPDFYPHACPSHSSFVSPKVLGLPEASTNILDTYLLPGLLLSPDAADELIENLPVCYGPCLCPIQCGASL